MLLHVENLMHSHGGPGERETTNRLATDQTDKTDRPHHRHCEEAPPTRQSH